MPDQMTATHTAVHGWAERDHPCPECRGNGEIASPSVSSEPLRCANCGGTGIDPEAAA